MAETKKENLHEGHRKRLKELYLQNGIDGLQEHQILELLLFYAIPRQDVNPLAHRLIKQFGSIGNVLKVDMSELQKAGLSQNAATFIHLINDISGYPMRSRLECRYLKNLEAVADFCFSLLCDRKLECMGIICLNAAGRVLHCEIAEYGATNRVPFNPRRIVDIAISHGAHSVVMMHNHPSGNPRPSEEDIKNTCKLMDLLMQIDLKLLDHVIVTQTESYAIVSDFKKDMITGEIENSVSLKWKEAKQTT